MSRTKLSRDKVSVITERGAGRNVPVLGLVALWESSVETGGLELSESEHDSSISYVFSSYYCRDFFNAYDVGAGRERENGVSH